MTETSEKPTLTIGLLWHTFFAENLGVGALTIANSNLIAEAVEKAGYRPVFRLLGSRGEMDYHSECPHENSFANIGYKALVNPRSPLNRALRECDIVFDIGGGDSFSDIYPWHRFRLILGSKMAARLAGVPLVLSPQTIGPFFTTLARLGAKSVMAMSKRIFARDETSFALLQEMGFGDKSSLTTDVAFALPFDVPADKEERDLASGRVKIGLNVSAYLYRRDEVPSDNVKLALDYRELIHAVLDRLCANDRYEVHLVPHVLIKSRRFEDDYGVCAELAERYPDVILPPRFEGPSKAKSYIAGLDFLAGSRMHATIAALSSDTAVLPMAYSRKFNGLFGSLGYRWNADLTKESAEDVLAKFDAALADLPGLRQEARAANAEAQDRLNHYREFLDKIVAELVAKRA